MTDTANNNDSADKTIDSNIQQKQILLDENRKWKEKRATQKHYLCRRKANLDFNKKKKTNKEPI